jgi:multidrug efflux pump subunit AcrA (membrane-fusion protein)
MIVGSGTAIGVAATGDDGPGLRVAAARVGSVDQTVEASGTVTSSLKLTPSFPTSGTVESVKVRVGDTVRKGQVLAQLDTSALQAEVDSANSILASARQKLEADKTGQTSSNSNATTAAYLTANHADSSTSITSLIRQVEAAQDAVIDGQKQVDAGQTAIDAAQEKVDADIRQNARLRDAQQQACASDSSSSPSPSSSSSSSSQSGSGCADAMAAYQAWADTLSAAMATLDEKISSQDDNLKDLASAIATLDKLVDQLQSAATSSGSSGGGSNSSNRPSTPSTSVPSRPSSAPSRPSSAPSRPSDHTSNQPNGRSSAGSGGTSPSSQPSSPNSGNQSASAAQLAADQKAIDAAEADLKVAQQNLAAATLKSPASGKVAEVGLVAGHSSSGKSITIVGTGIPGVQATVPLGQVDQVKVGQSVTVAVDGVATKLHGTVTSIGMLNASSSGANPTYQVTVQLDAASRQLYDGSGADLVISTGSARNVLTVPNSAIHSTRGGGHTVTVLDGGKTSTVRVTLGASGRDVTEVKSGLKAGQKVVLADPSEPLPSSATSNSGNGKFPGGGGFGGGPVNLGGN